MAETRKDAGEARQRPRPPAADRAAEEAAPATPASRPAGIAPVLDRETGQLTGREGPFKGMISNPHVKNWIQGAREPAEEARPDATPGSGGEAPGTEPQRNSVDAGPAPRPPAS
jgi:hypothetical protein